MPPCPPPTVGPMPASAIGYSHVEQVAHFGVQDGSIHGSHPRASGVLVCVSTGSIVSLAAAGQLGRDTLGRRQLSATRGSWERIGSIAAWLSARRSDPVHDPGDVRLARHASPLRLAVDELCDIRVKRQSGPYALARGADQGDRHQLHAARRLDGLERLAGASSAPSRSASIASPATRLQRVAGPRRPWRPSRRRRQCPGRRRHMRLPLHQ